MHDKSSSQSYYGGEHEIGDNDDVEDVESW